MSPTPPSPPTGPWVLVGSDPDLGLPDGARVDLTLAIGEDGAATAAGMAACNRYRGTVDLDDGSWAPRDGWVVTRLACPPPLLAGERDYLAALDRVTRWARPRPDGLVLTGDHVRLVFARATDADGLGTGA